MLATMSASFTTSLSLAALAITLVPSARAQTASSSILQIRQGAFTADTHRVVLDMAQLPNAAPKLTETAQGWQIDIIDSDGRSISTSVKMEARKALKRTFFLPKTASKPARLVVDFEDAPAPPPVKTTEEQIEDLFGLPAWQPAAGEAAALTFSGFVEAEGRWFPKDSADGASDKVFGSIAAEPSLKFQLAANHKISLTGFGRVDTVTAARSHVDVREAKYEGRFGAIDVTVGVDRRFWGQLEAGHLVDVVGQVDTLEDIDAEDKLGQPLAEVKWTGSKASLAAIALPYFRDRPFPKAKDRPNAPMRITAKPIYDGTTSHWTPDFAVRGTLTAGPVDVAVHYVNGLNREPRLLPLTSGLTPVYDRMSQVGGDALAVLGPLRLKAEGFYRRLRNDKMAAGSNFGGFGVGAEYTFAGALGAGDLNLLAEYYHDTRGRKASTIFDNDIFVGFRYSGNDIASTEVLGGLLLDTRRSSKFVTLEACRRLSDAFKLSLDVRMPVAVAADDPLQMLRDDGFMQLKLQYHF